MDGREALLRLVVELERERDGDVAAVLEDDDSDAALRRRVRDLDSLEVCLVLPMRASGAVESDIDRETRLESDDDTLALARCEETAEGVVNVCSTTDDDGRDEKSTEPVKTRTSEGFEPERTLRERAANGVDNLLLRDGTLDAEGLCDVRRERDGLSTKVVENGDFALITTVQPVEQLLREERSDVAKQVLDGLILDDGVLDGDRTLQDADSLRVLVEDRVNVLSSPERILQNMILVM